jgi:adenine deaminase
MITPAITKKIMDIAAGNAFADTVILNADVLNVYTGEIVKDHGISIGQKWIAYVGPDPSHTIGPNTRVIEAKGKTVIPGLIDGHTHLAWLYTVAEFLTYAMAGGTTTIITESLEPYPISGLSGTVDFLESLKSQPIKIYATAPAMATTSRATMGIKRQDLLHLLERDDVLGLGESYWQSVFQNPELFLPLFHDVRAAKKTLEGHSAGASEKKLMAYAAAGISSCHEPIKADEVIDRLRLGLYVMIREGSIRHDLETISVIKDASIDFRRLILVTDGVTPKRLMEKGYMEYVVQKAIDCGFNPVTAIQMATLNVAEHFSMDHLIGGIAPGRCADLLIIPGLHRIKAEYVISNGEVIAKNGKLLDLPRVHTFSEESVDSLKLTKPIQPKAFTIEAGKTQTSVKTRIINMVTDLVTTEIRMDLPVVAGQIMGDMHQDVVKVAAIDRAHHAGKTFTGFIKGFGISSGAFACTAAWDTSNIIIVGASDEAMALAANRLRELKGGAVVCEKSLIIAELPLPIFGLISALPMPALAKKVAEINHAAFELGVPFCDPLLTLITLTGAAIPFLRICEEGLVNLKTGETMKVIVGQGA